MKLRIIPSFRAVMLAGGAALLAAPALAHQNLPDLTRLSLEELAQVDIESVSRRAEPLSRAAAAAFVISAEDIRRSGATSLPEVLRLAPNLQVQRVDGANYAISARGFGGFETSNKVLILIDGRSVYTTLFSGILWDAQGTVLEDIERIDVISGPGGTLYGANAVNAVISITTRSAFDTQGPAASFVAGDEDTVANLRYGWRSGDWAARAYIQGFERDETLLPNGGGDAGDPFDGVRGGVRADWTGERDTLRLDLGLYDHTSGIADLEGWHGVGEWERELAGGGLLAVQAYADRTERVQPTTVEIVETADLFLQHALAPRGRHSLVWGGGYRAVDNALYAPTTATLQPPQRNITLGNIFVQDQIALTPDVILTVGVKAEENSFSGSEILPNVRLAWSRPGGGLLWGAVSRAARTPSRIDRDLTLPGFLLPSQFESEILTAYEIGYRATPTADTSFSVTAFVHDYDDIRTVGFTGPGVLTVEFQNGAKGQTWGIEAWGAWQINPVWRMDAGVATLEKDFELKPGFVDITAIASKGFDPEHQILLGAHGDIGDRLELDVRLRFVGELPGSNVDDYVGAVARVGYQLTENVELELVVENLLDDRHLETQDPVRQRDVERSLHAGLRMGF